MCSISGCIQLHVEFTIFYCLLSGTFYTPSSLLTPEYIEFLTLWWVCTFSIVYTGFSDFAPCLLLGLYCCTLHTLYSSKTASPFKSVHCFTILCFCIYFDSFVLNVSLFPFILNDYPLISVRGSNDRLLETLSFLRYKWSLFPLFHHCTSYF